MRKFFKKITNKANDVTLRIYTTIDNKRAEGYVDSGLKILIAVVLGALLLTTLYGLFKDTILKKLADEVTRLFAYTGTTT